MIAVIAAGWFLQRTHGFQTPSAEAAVAGPAAHKDPLEIRVDEALSRQIRAGTPEWAGVSGTLSVPGRIEADETRLARAGTPVGGRIADLKAVEGQPVKRGQVLATLHSVELTESQLNLLKAGAQAQTAERSVARARQLLEAGVISAAELQRRESEHSQATAEIVSSRERLRVQGMSDEAIAQVERTRTVVAESRVLSSIDGVILERHATPGQVVQPADILFVIADLSQVWLVADVPEQSAGLIEPGKMLEAEIPALPGHPVRGRLTFVSATVSPETHTVRVRMDLPNPHHLFKPSMLANIRLQDRAELRLVVPATAIVREGNQDVVFVEIAPSTYALRVVTTGGEFGGKRVIASGLDGKERLVLDGGFHLNNERKRASLQTGE